MEQKVLLRFEDFELETPLETSDNICFDSVHIYDGDKATSANQFGRPYCGQEAPGDVLSTGRHLLVRFTSDTTTVARGFRATYTTKKTETIINSKTDLTVITISVYTILSSDQILYFFDRSSQNVGHKTHKRK